MAVTEQVPQTSHTANGITTVFPFTFLLLQESDLQVQVDGATLATGYTVTGLGDSAGGSVVIIPAPANGAKVDLYRDTAIDRSTDYQDNGDIRARVLNADLDRIVMMMQEIGSGAKSYQRTMRAPVGETLDELPLALARAGRILGFDAAGQVQAMLPAAGDATALALDLLDGTSASKGPALMAFNPALTYAAGKIGSAMLDGLPQLIWWITDPTERAAIKAGTSTTNHTATIQAAMALMGSRGLHFGHAGWQWNISGTLQAVSGATYAGKARLKAIAASNMGYLFEGTNCVKTTLWGLELDGNVDATGSQSYGVYFHGGTGNRIEDLSVHDTMSAGIRAEAETDIKVLFNFLNGNGRAASSDNHGLMIGSNSAGNVVGGVVAYNRISGAMRKGLAVYCFSTGYVKGLRLIGNIIDSCDLGGIYLAADEAMTHVIKHVEMIGNMVLNCYANYEINSVANISGYGNHSYHDTYAGMTYGYGWIIQGAKDINLTGGIVDGAPVRGVSVAPVGATASQRVKMTGFAITNSNQLNDAAGTGLYVTGSTDCEFEVDISDTTGKQVYGIYENATGTARNVYRGTVRDATTKRVFLGSDTSSFSKHLTGEVVVPYSASMTPDAFAGSVHLIEPTNATAFTINALANGVRGDRCTIVVKNSTAGALGVATWTGYKAAAWTQPASGFSKAVTFRHNGTTWVQVSPATPDIPN